MSDPNQDLEMAELAYRGENYQEAYRKYSDVVEKEFENKKAWIGKGLSAARKSAAGEIGFKECSVCLEKAEEIGLDPDDKEYIADQIIEISRNYIDLIHDRVDQIVSKGGGKVKDELGEYIAEKIRYEADVYSVYNDHWDYYKQTLDFSEEALEYNNSPGTKKRLVDLIDQVLEGADGQFHKDYLEVLNERRDKKIQQVLEVDPDYDPKPTPQSAEEDCFIATATMGSYEAGPVLELRRFRDTVLNRSTAGRFAIQFYYRYSPPIARTVERHTGLTIVIRYLLVWPATLVASLVNWARS